MPDHASSVGRSLPTSKAEAKVTGAAEFGADIYFKGLLIGGVLRSPFPHARIKHIDVSAAETAPGVAAVITGRDFTARYGPAVADQTILARSVVRYAGDPVAAVAARDEDAAAEALSLITVDYEPLPAVFDAESALDPESLLVHPGLGEYEAAAGVFTRAGTNICNHFRLRKGDVEKTLESCRHVFTHKLTTQMAQHASMEPHVSTAMIDGSGRLHIWSNTQTPFVIRKSLARLFGLPISQVQVTVTRLGGGFGGKSNPKLEPLVAALAYRAGNRPVRILQDREEEFCGTTVTRHPVSIEVTSGLDDAGKIQARRVELVFNTGAYADTGPRVCRNAGFSSPGPYVIPNVSVDSLCVYTNTPPAGAMRGFGIPQVTWAVESHTDMMARELGLDPLRFRLDNCVIEGSASATGQVLHSVGLKETLRSAAETIDLDRPRPQGVGRGIACGHKSTVSPSASSCIMRVNEDGTVHLLVSSVDMGQGSETVLAQIAAEELGIEPERVTVASPDTDVTPYDMATVSSRSTFFMGNAVRNAARRIKEKVLDIAEDMLEANRNDLVYENGRVFVKGSPERGFALRETPQGESFYAGALQVGRGKPLVAEGAFSAEDATPLDRETGQGAKPCAFWMYFSQAAEVSVDEKTGRVTVHRIASAHDVGRAINPLLLEGQIEGACIMGLGEALYEKVECSEGQVLNPNFSEYCIPSFRELPHITPLILENPHKDGPFGAKGMGEPAQAAVAAAVANAIFDAVGVRITSLPITPEKILQALERKKKR